MGWICKQSISLQRWKIRIGGDWNERKIQTTIIMIFFPRLFPCQWEDIHDSFRFNEWKFNANKLWKFRMELIKVHFSKSIRLKFTEWIDSHISVQMRKLSSKLFFQKIPQKKIFWNQDKKRRFPMCWGNACYFFIKSFSHLEHHQKCIT